MRSIYFEKVIELFKEKDLGFDLIKEKIPELRSSWKTGLIIAFVILVVLAWMIFFWWLDRLIWYGPLVSQLLVALITANLEYMAMVEAPLFRAKYREQAFRIYFFSRIIPIFVCWSALIFHPLLVRGTQLLPSWIAVPLGIFLVIYCFLLSIPAVTGEISLAHLLGVYTLFPEEGKVIRSGIYTYVRHPIYAGNLCLTLGFALLINNLMAVLTALIFLIPALIEIRLEDDELTRRSGERHRKYIEKTGALFPHLEHAPNFLKLVFLLEDVRRDGQT